MVSEHVRACVVASDSYVTLVIKIKGVEDKLKQISLVSYFSERVHAYDCNNAVAAAAVGRKDQRRVSLTHEIKI